MEQNSGRHNVVSSKKERKKEHKKTNSCKRDLTVSKLALLLLLLRYREISRSSVKAPACRIEAAPFVLTFPKVAGAITPAPYLPIFSLLWLVPGISNADHHNGLSCEPRDMLVPIAWAIWDLSAR